MNNNFSVSGVFSEAWQVLKNNVSYVYYLLAPMLALSLVGLILYPHMVYMGAGSEVDLAKTVPAFLLEIASGIAGIFATISFLFFLRNGKKDSFATWKSYVRLLPKYIGVSILQGLMILAGLVLFIIPGIYLALRYAFVTYRTLEHPTESVKNLFAAEARSTEGNRLNLLLLSIIFIITVVIVSALLEAVLTGVLGSQGIRVSDFLLEVLITPFFTLVSITAYLKLTSKQGETPAPVTETEEPAEFPEETAPVGDPVL